MVKSLHSILHTRKPSKQQLQLDRIEEKIDALHALQAEAKSPMQVVGPMPTVKQFNLILHYLAKGEKIMAIREYRTYFDVGLKEAKDAIEGLS